MKLKIVPFFRLFRVLVGKKILWLLIVWLLYFLLLFLFFLLLLTFNGKFTRSKWIRLNKLTVCLKRGHHWWLRFYILRFFIILIWFLLRNSMRCIILWFLFHRYCKFQRLYWGCRLMFDSSKVLWEFKTLIWIYFSKESYMFLSLKFLNWNL